MRRVLALALLLFCALIAIAQQGPEIVTQTLPDGAPGEQYDVSLRAQGGTEPLQWEIAKGSLPAGLKLSDGRIVGEPTVPGESKLTLRVTDSAKPPRTAERDFTLRIRAALEVRWEEQPTVIDGEIHGAVTVTNGLKDPYDLTLIIVGVNEVGKAFALGYQHWKIMPRSEMRTIKFGEGDKLPRGSYVVHVDAVGEDTVKGKIYRSRLQTPMAVPIP